MKKYGFTFMEVMLSVILFSLMVGGILGAYTKIQSANIKMANTQEAIQAAESFLERINDTSLEYMIDDTTYLSSPNINSGGKRKIVASNKLAIINKTSLEKTTFFQECQDGICTIKMKLQDKDPIDLINNSNVSIDKLNFEIYPEQQYVNINIVARNLHGENLYKSGITLSTTVSYKNFEIYQGGITPEDLCKDVCSISEITGNSILHADYSNNSSFDNNTTLNSCTLKYGEGLGENFISYTIEFFEILFGSNGSTVYQAAKNCANNLNKTWCNVRCRETNSGNPYNCGYIRYQITHGIFTGTTCEQYNAFSKDKACQNMCLASIFSCLPDDNENSLVRRTGIKITTGDENYVGKYLQNPKSYNVNDNGTYNSAAWIGSNGWTGCSTDRQYRPKVILIDAFNTCEDRRGDTYCRYIFNDGSIIEPVYRRCINGAYYCDGTHYGASFDTGIILMKEEEYQYGCIKWTQVQNTPASYSGRRIIYTPETDPGNTLGECICEVDYKYSLFAGGFIEYGTYVGQTHYEGGIGVTYSESEYEYRPRPYDLIYVDSYTPGDSRPLEGVKNWVGLSEYLDTTKCKNNSLCARNQSYDGHSNFAGYDYNLTTTGGFYKLDSPNINYKDLKCSNTGFYSCINSGCCPASGHLDMIYNTQIEQQSNSTYKQIYCTQYITGSDGSHGIRSGDQCLIVSGCAKFQSGYNQVNLITGSALQYYCTNKLHDQWMDNQCKKYKGYGCTTYTGLTMNENDIKKYYCEQSGYIWDITTNSCKRFTGIGCLPGTIHTFNTGDSFPYYCTNNFPGYDRENLNGCRKCTSTYTGYEEYLNNVSWPADNSIKENYCEKKLNYTWTSNKCCKTTTRLGSCKNETGINLDIAKQYYCEGQGGHLDGGNCKRPAHLDRDYDTTMENYCENYLHHYWWPITDKCCANSPLLFLICGTEYSINNNNTAIPYYCSSNFSNINIHYLRQGGTCRRPISLTCTSYHTQTINGSDANPYYCRNGLGKIRYDGKCCSQTGELYTGVNISITDAHREHYCKSGLHSTRSGNQCLECTASGNLYDITAIDTGEALEYQCTNNVTGANGTIGIRSGDNKCYAYSGEVCVKRNIVPIAINLNDAKKYYCEISNGLRSNNKCFDVTKPTTSCIYNGSPCPDDGNRAINDTNKCEFVRYKGCVDRGEGKNIYKDYTYTCDMSITQQANNIISIIDTLTDLAQSPTGSPMDVLHENFCHMTRWDILGLCN